MKTRMNRRKANRKSSRKANRKTRRSQRRMRGGNTNAQTYKSPFFVNMSDRYGADIMQGPALSQ